MSYSQVYSIIYKLYKYNIIILNYYAIISKLFRNMLNYFQLFPTLLIYIQLFRTIKN